MAGLVELEPRLTELEADVRGIRDDGSNSWFCSNFVWMPVAGRLKALVGTARLPVGEETRTGVLFDGRSYMVAFYHLSRLMPPCRDCGCSLFDPIRLAQLDSGTVPPLSR